MRAVLRVLAGHGENTVLAPFDVFYLLPCSHLEVGAVEDLVPKSKQVFLGKFSLLELAIHRKFDRAGHHQLLTRVLGHSAANFVTLEREVLHLVLNGAQGSGNAGRTRSNDQDIVDVGNGSSGAFGCESIQNIVDALPSLVDCILDQGQTAEFADDEQVRNGGLELARESRHVRPHAGARHHHRDRADRACIRTKAMPDALVAVDDDGLTPKHGKHVAFGTNGRAGRATDAVRVIDMRMLRFRPLGEEFAFFRCGASFRVPFLDALEVVTQEEKGKGCCDDKGYQGIHTALKTLPPKAHRDLKADME